MTIHLTCSLSNCCHYQGEMLLPNITVNKRAQMALGRSPEEKVKGQSRAIYIRPQGHYFGRGPLDIGIYQI